MNNCAKCHAEMDDQLLYFLTMGFVSARCNSCGESLEKSIAERLTYALGCALILAGYFFSSKEDTYPTDMEKLIIALAAMDVVIMAELQFFDSWKPWSGSWMVRIVLNLSVFVPTYAVIFPIIFCDC